MMNKMLWWIIVGAGVLLLLLIIAIVDNKDTPVAEEQNQQTIKASDPEPSTKEPIVTQNTIEEKPNADKVKEPVAAPDELKPEQPSNVPSEKKPTVVPDQAPVQPPTSTPAATEPAPSTPIKEGTYQVGSDIDPGEYIVFSDGITLLENTKDQTGNPESIVFNVALDGRSHAYVTLQQGEYFKLTGGEMYPIATAPELQPSDGIYKDGQYKVGTDIPAGSYHLIVDDQSDIGFYEISKNSRQDMMDLIVSDVIEGQTDISVSNGQYLTIRNAYIEVK